MGQPGGSFYEWRRVDDTWHARLSRPLQSLEDKASSLALPFTRRLTITDRRRMWFEGLAGRATVLKAPNPKHHATASGEAIGRFKARVELPGNAPYEVAIWQPAGATELDMLQPPAVVECRVDPASRSRVLLCAPEPEAPRVQDASGLVASGVKADARVLDSADLKMAAPGTGHPCHLLALEITAPDGSGRTWTVSYGQRVPPKALHLLAPGSALVVAHAPGDEKDVAVDWAATTGGLCS